MLHGDHNGVIAPGDSVGGQAVALGAQHDGKLVLGLQSRILHTDGAVVQRHGGSLKAQFVQAVHTGRGPFGVFLPQPCPGHLEYRAHADPHRTAAERVAAGGREKHGVHAQCSGTAEDSPNVGGVDDAFQHSHAAGSLTQFLDGMLFRAAHGAQHPPGQGVAGQRLQGLAGSSVHGGIGAAGQHGGSRTFDVGALHQKGKRHAARVQRGADDLGAFGDEDAFFRFQLVAQLRLGQTCIRGQFRHIQVRYFNDIGHGELLFLRGICSFFEKKELLI